MAKVADRVKETSTTTGTGAVALGGAATGFRTFVAGIGDGLKCYYAIVHRTLAEWEVGIGTVTDGSPDTLSRDTVLASSNAGSAVNFSAGTKDVFVTQPAAAVGDPSICFGRLTLESGVPVSTTDQTGKSTVYFTPFKGNRIALYNGASWDVLLFSEVSIALSALTSGKNYDVFAYNAGGVVTLELSAAWTDDTTRADALALQDGVYVKSGAPTRRYLGTFRTTGTTTTEDSGGGTVTNVGGKRFLWNYYNRVDRQARVIDTTTSWNYATGTWRQARGQAGNQVEVVIGIAEDWLEVFCHCTTFGFSNNTLAMMIGVGLDSTTVPSGNVDQLYNNSGSGHVSNRTASWGGIPAAGYHKFCWLESGADGTSTFYGSNGSKSGLNLKVRN